MNAKQAFDALAISTSVEAYTRRRRDLRKAGERYSAALEENEVSEASKLEEELDYITQDLLVIADGLVDALTEAKGT